MEQNHKCLLEFFLFMLANEKCESLGNVVNKKWQKCIYPRYWLPFTQHGFLPSTQEIWKKAEDNFQMSAKPQNNGIMRVNNVNSFPRDKKRGMTCEHMYVNLRNFSREERKKTKTIIWQSFEKKTEIQQMCGSRIGKHRDKETENFSCRSMLNGWKDLINSDFIN